MDEELDPSELTSEEMLAVHINEMIEAYEAEDDSDNAFHLEVCLADGRRFCLPYIEHTHGAIVLMDGGENSPGRPRILAMRHVVEVSLDPECRFVHGELSLPELSLPVTVH